MKEILVEFIRQIENMDFCSDADVKRLYDKAREMEAHLTSVDYIGKPSNIGRLLEAAEKLEREPDVLLVEMPPCRMVTSGLMEDDDALNQFNAMWMKLGAQIADKINPRDFMYHDARQNKLVWMFMLEDGMTKADTQGYDIINFEGGVFASALADSWEYIEYERVFKGIQAWLSRQEHLAPDESPDRHLLYHFAGPHSAKMKEYNYGKVRYYVPIKTDWEE